MGGVVTNDSIQANVAAEIERIYGRLETDGSTNEEMQWRTAKEKVHGGADI